MQDPCNSPVPGQMMRRPLLISALLRHAERYCGRREIVSYCDGGAMHRYTWQDCHARARRMAGALADLGVCMGDRVGTLAWNGYRHLELYYAVSGMGAVIHTINPRLHRDQLVWMINDADDKYVFFDRAFASIVDEIAAQCPGVRAFVLLGEADDTAALENVVGLLNYESLLAASADDRAWPVFDEDAASGLCYTSGTTGNPKGVLYSHRSTVLHAYASVAPDALSLSGGDCIMPVVPMFHVNAWGLPYSAALVGAKLVLPGPGMDGATLYRLCEQEGVTITAGVPTVWLGLVNHLREHELRFTSLARTVIGGSACPPALMETLRHDYGIEVIHAFGMTELSPIATVCRLLPGHLALPVDQQEALRLTQGRVLYGVDMKIVDDDGIEQVWNGMARGHLLVRGQWVVDAYFKQAPGAPLQDGWFPTGDVATISADAYLHITDRSKDLIKSGGEWIGSIDLENIAMDHPAVLQAACIGIPHPKWDERPLLVVVLHPGATVTRQELLDLFIGKVARWWIPDDVTFVDRLPTGPTGKIQKNHMREQFRDFSATSTANSAAINTQQA